MAGSVRLPLLASWRYKSLFTIFISGIKRSRDDANCPQKCNQTEKNEKNYQRTTNYLSTKPSKFILFVLPLLPVPCIALHVYKNVHNP